MDFSEILEWSSVVVTVRVPRWDVVTVENARPFQQHFGDVLLETFEKIRQYVRSCVPQT